MINYIHRKGYDDEAAEEPEENPEEISESTEAEGRLSSYLWLLFRVVGWGFLSWLSLSCINLFLILFFSHRRDAWLFFDFGAMDLVLSACPDWHHDPDCKAIL